MCPQVDELHAKGEEMHPFGQGCLTQGRPYARTTMVAWKVKAQGACCLKLVGV